MKLADEPIPRGLSLGPVFIEEHFRLIVHNEKEAQVVGIFSPNSKWSTALNGVRVMTEYDKDEVTDARPRKNFRD